MSRAAPRPRCSSRRRWYGVSRPERRAPEPRPGTARPPGRPRRSPPRAPGPVPEDSWSQRVSTRWTASAPTRPPPGGGGAPSAVSAATMSSGSVRPRGQSRNGRDCSPPRPPCEPICSSKACTVPVAGSYMELTMTSATCGKVSVRRTASAALRRRTRAGPCRPSVRRRGPPRRRPRAPRSRPPRRRGGSRSPGGWPAWRAGPGDGARPVPVARPSMSGKEMRPRLPEASTIGSESLAGCSSCRPLDGRCRAMRTASRASEALRACAGRGGARAVRSPPGRGP